MSFIIDKEAYRTAMLYRSHGQEIIANLFLRKAYGR